MAKYKPIYATKEKIEEVRRQQERASRDALLKPQPDSSGSAILEYVFFAILILFFGDWMLG